MADQTVRVTAGRRGWPGAVRAALLVAFVGLLASPAGAGGRPEGVMVVVNEDSWASLAVANEFIRLRHIPSRNVVYLSLGDLRDFEIIDVNAFRLRVLAPVLEARLERELEDTIDCIAYSADLPYAVNVSPDVGSAPVPSVITKTAAINGLTFLYKSVMEKDAGKYLALGANWYARRIIRQTTAGEAPWSSTQREAFAKAVRFVRQKKWADAEPLVRDVLKDHSGSPDLHYDLACCLAQLGKLDESIAELRQSAAAGWWDRVRAETDDDLAPIRTHKDFAAIVQDMKPPAAERIQPPRGFRGSYSWKMDGELASAGGGANYLLSAMLAVTSGRGNSVREALNCLDRAASADGTCPRGTIYFMVNDDIRSKTRQYGFSPAISRLESLSVKAQAVKGTLPEKRPDVAGLMAGSASFDWGRCGSTILPGAICEHLTSNGGEMHQRAGQTPISEWIRAGASGTSGTVTEPYAIQAKFPTPMIQYYYAGGCTMAEAFYQSLAGPYQLLIVGDPLCRPWAGVPKVTVDGVAARETVKGRLVLRLGVSEPKDFKIKQVELFVDGRSTGAIMPDRSIELDTTHHCDGWHELRLTVTGDDAVETQGERILPVIVANASGGPLQAAAENLKPVLGQDVRVAAKCPGAESIVLRHNGRDLAKIEGEKGIATISTRRLGLGSVRIESLATDTGGKVRIAGAPIELEVLPPKPLAALNVDGNSLSPGLKLAMPGKDLVAIKDLSVLALAGAKRDEALVIEGYVDVPADDIYQVQARFLGQMSVSVDDSPLDVSEEKTWHFVPVALAKGFHLLKIAGTPKDLDMDIRFGGPGAVSISDIRFRHEGKLPLIEPPKKK